jgi:hypothetical protein
MAKYAPSGDWVRARRTVGPAPATLIRPTSENHSWKQALETWKRAWTISCSVRRVWPNPPQQQYLTRSLEDRKQDARAASHDFPAALKSGGASRVSSSERLNGLWIPDMVRRFCGNRILWVTKAGSLSVYVVDSKIREVFDPGEDKKIREAGKRLFMWPTAAWNSLEYKPGKRKQ